MKNNRSEDYIFERLNAAGEKMVKDAIKKEVLKKDLETGYELRKFTLPGGKIYFEYVQCTIPTRGEPSKVFTALCNENGTPIPDSLWRQCGEEE
jgi:hypothetical protein